MASAICSNAWVTCLSIVLCVHVVLASGFAPARAIPDYQLAPRQDTPTSAPLVDFQVYEPVLTPESGFTPEPTECTQLLMDHVFAFSYGRPFVGKHRSHPDIQV